MTYRLLLRNRAANGYTATALAWPDCTVEAPTREEALARMQQAIRELLAESEVVELEVPDSEAQLPKSDNGTFGMFRDDPTFAEFLEEVQAYRAERNKIADG